MQIWYDVPLFFCLFVFFTVIVAQETQPNVHSSVVVVAQHTSGSKLLPPTIVSGSQEFLQQVATGIIKKLPTTNEGNKPILSNFIFLEIVCKFHVH